MGSREAIQVATAVDPAWRGTGLATAVFVVFPVVATVAVAGAYRAAAAHPPWLAGPLIYSFACWLAVAATWRWTSRRGLRAQVFLFRPPAGADWIGAIVGAAAGVLIVWPASQWIAHLLGASVHGMDFDVRQLPVFFAVLGWAIVTAPLCEEILFRGLMVAYLQARGWSAWAVALASSLAFAAIHVRYFGLGLVIFVLPWSGIVMFLRLWRGSLTPGWMMHLLNNIFAYLIIPWLTTRAA